MVYKENEIMVLFIDKDFLKIVFFVVMLDEMLYEWVCKSCLVVGVFYGDNLVDCIYDVVVIGEE